MDRELLFSVTKADCRFDSYRGSGKGGQKRNKTSSAVRCTHVASGAVGQAEDTRSWHQNRELAFRRMAESDAFKRWHRMEVARLSGREAAARDYAERESRKAVVEVKDEAGRWVVDPPSPSR